MKFVIAKYKEDTSWARNLPHILITKEIEIPNVGREATSYLYFIVSNYKNLRGEYVFCQGHPFDHWPNFVSDIKKHRSVGTVFSCRKDGTPNEPDLPIHEICQALDLPILDVYTFRTGAQFRINAQQIKARPLEWYAKALILSITEPKAPWVFERIWPLVWDIKSTASLD